MARKRYKPEEIVAKLRQVVVTPPTTRLRRFGLGSMDDCLCEATA
jgi:hypothetical protein